MQKLADAASSSKILKVRDYSTIDTFYGDCITSFLWAVHSKCPEVQGCDIVSQAPSDMHSMCDPQLFCMRVPVSVLSSLSRLGFLNQEVQHEGCYKGFFRSVWYRLLQAQLAER